MRKMFGVVIVLLMMYITFQVVYSYLVVQKVRSYEIKVDGIEYRVNEVFTSGHKSADREVNDVNNYYYEVTDGEKIIFTFKIMGKYTGVKEYLENLIIYKKGELVCAYPIFKGEVENMDVMCNNKGDYYLYGAVRGDNKELDIFVDSLKALGYQHDSWNDVNLKTKKIDTFYVYSDNVTTDQNLTVWQYKGFYRITSRGDKLYSLNTLDKYEPTLTTMVNQYYVIPDYKEKHSFNRLYLTNLISGSIETFSLGTTIPYDSFIQGVAENKIYLIDRSSKIQYSIDIYKKQVQKTGDLDNGTKYYNEGKWENKSIYEVLDNSLGFTYKENIPEELNEYKPDFIDEVGGETDGYYYMYKKVKGSMEVYRIDKQNLTIPTLLFKIPTVNNPKYVSGDIYFISNDTLYFYRSNVGLKPLVKYSEFVFNQSNLYNVFVSK